VITHDYLENAERILTVRVRWWGVSKKRSPMEIIKEVVGKKKRGRAPLYRAGHVLGPSRPKKMYSLIKVGLGGGEWDLYLGEEAPREKGGGLSNNRSKIPIKIERYHRQVIVNGKLTNETVEAVMRSTRTKGL